jgi:hypothetical protein
MATYGQWIRNQKITRVAWVCGEESALSRSVRDAYTRALSAVPPVILWGADDGTWNSLLATPAGPRLVIVLGAGELPSLEPLPHLLGEEFDGAYTVFVSSEKDFRRTDKVLVPSLAALRDSRHGQMIRCVAPADAEARAAIVADWWPGAGRNVASVLLEASGGSLTRAWHAADKAVRAGLQPEARLVPTVCANVRDEQFADLLVKGDRRSAMAAAAVIPPDDIGLAIGLLAARLQLLPLVRDALARRESSEDTVRRLRADPWVLRILRPYAGSYDAERVERCRVLLAITETAWRSGVRVGILEAVAALW